MDTVGPLATALGVDVLALEIRRGEEIAPAFEQLKGACKPCMCVPIRSSSSTGFTSNHGCKARGFRRCLVIGISSERGLVSYGPDVPSIVSARRRLRG